MAKKLQTDMPFPLLLDPNHTFRKQLQTGNLSLGQMMGPKSGRNYLKAMSHFRDARVIPSEASLTPVVVILDANQDIVWRHIGQALGDYPSVEEVVNQVRAL